MKKDLSKTLANIVFHKYLFKATVLQWVLIGYKNNNNIGLHPIAPIVLDKTMIRMSIFCNFVDSPSWGIFPQVLYREPRSIVCWVVGPHLEPRGPTDFHRHQRALLHGHHLVLLVSRGEENHSNGLKWPDLLGLVQREHQIHRYLSEPSRSYEDHQSLAPDHSKMGLVPVVIHCCMWGRVRNRYLSSDRILSDFATVLFCD